MPHLPLPYAIDGVMLSAWSCGGRPSTSFSEPCSPQESVAGKKLDQIIFKMESSTNHSLLCFFPKTVGHFLLWNPHFAPSRGQAEHLQCVFACFCVCTCSLTRLWRERTGWIIIYLWTPGTCWAGCIDCLWMRVTSCCDHSMTEVD